jgi:hypothetical protein
MLVNDLDRLQKQRVAELRKSLPPSRSELVSRLFIGESVARTIGKPKLLFEGYRLDKILPVLPFSPITYVATCRGCLKTSDDLDTYVSLVRHGLIVPVLMGRYSEYPAPLVEELRIRDHISCYELSLYSAVRLYEISGSQSICPDCFEKRRDKVLEQVRDAPKVLKFVKAATNKLLPPVYPDYELLDEFERAVSNKDGDKIVQLSDLAQAIKEMRWAQVWNGALTLDAHDLAAIPENLAAEFEQSRQLSCELRQYVADGLGVKVPLDIPIDRYAELVVEFQPRIASVVDRIVKAASRKRAPFEAAGKELSKLNNEIARIKGLKRFMVMEAIAAPIRKNKALIATSLTMGALFGIGGGLVGCAAAAATKGIVSRAKKTKYVKGAIEAITDQPEVKRLGRKVKSETQPYIDTLVSKYLQAELPAVSVLAMRKSIGDAKQPPT